ncbi:tRNA pseudouridine(55) synthase TruB [bacterium]|nr:tRNA pseudouridine(55) synthase TruB [candidate division CSSED10-310 bacterium]
MANSQHIPGLSHGLILLDKPPGVTSRFCVNVVQHTFRGLKAGHAGTLDPFATGLLPVCLGRATKLVDCLRKGQKTYRARLTLGFITDTQDITGDIIGRKKVPEDLTLNNLQNTAVSLVGTLEQIPPMFSARKWKGIRLYELARKNIEVERQPRRIQVYSIQVHSYTPPDVDFSVTCSEGTYVRSLGIELAALIGTFGTLSALRRMKIGRFDVEGAVTLDQFKESTSRNDAYSLVLPAEFITRHLPALTVKNGHLKRFLNGAPLQEDDLVSLITPQDQDCSFALYDEDKHYLGLMEWRGRASDGKSILKTIRLPDIDT